MNDLQRKLIFGFCIVVVIASFIVPSLLIYNSHIEPHSTSRATSSVGVVEITVKSSICGDGVCDAATENCENCPEDCGECLGDTTGVGGGGGGFRVQLVNFIFDPDLIQERIPQGGSLETKVDVINIGRNTADIIFEVVELDYLVFLQSDRIDLRAGETKELYLDILAGQNAEPDVYLGEITGTAGDIVKNVQLVIRIYEEDAPILLEVSIPEDYKIINPGDQIMGEVKVTSKFNETVSGKIEYSIRDSNMKVLSSREESVVLAPGETIFKQTFNTDKELKGDYYLFYSSVTYDSVTYSDAAAFKIEEIEYPFLFFGLDLIYAGSLLAIILIIAVLFILFRKRIFKSKKATGKKELSREGRDEVISEAISKLKQIKLKVIKSKNMIPMEEYFKIIRIFFSEYYAIKYRFTFQELYKDLSSRKIRQKNRVLNFIKRVSHIAYVDSPITNSQFNSLVEKSISFLGHLKRGRKKKD